MGHASLLCFILIALDLTSADEVKSKVVKLDQGRVKGYKSSEGDFFVFYGIPYATTPRGPHKFKGPLPAPTWADTFEAVEKNIFCPQTSIYIASSQYSEDCLVANVFVPTTVKDLLPVVVYVHGGAYILGSGNMASPRSMVDQGRFIAITFNHRLGIHGFLCLGTEDAPGNAGMKDQVALLRWVKKNIAAFGGDPNDVTISGASAGASAVELLMLSETTKGLFNKVIPDSGNAVSVWSIQLDPIENAKRFARFHNVTTNDVRVLEEFYKTTTFEQLTSFPFLGERDSVFVTVPCIERDTGTDIFIKDAPLDILKSGNFPKVPVLIGFANMEGLLRAQQFELWKDEMNEDFATFLPADMQFENEAEKKEVARKIKDFYFGNNKVNEDSLMGYVDYFSDVIFTYPALKTVKLQAEAGNDNVFLYQYSYSDAYTVSKRLFPHLGGADHATQFLTMFDFAISIRDDNLITDGFKKMKNVLKNLWTNFIITGKPLAAPTSEFPKGWPATSAKHSPYMELNLPSELRKNLLQKRYQFWEELYERYYRAPVSPTVPFVGHSEL